MKKATVRIENWFIENGRVNGKAYDHPKFPNGSPVTTSPITVNGTPNYVETANTVYLLGEPMATPFSPIQNQALHVVKKALVDDVMKDANVFAEILGPSFVNEAAHGTAQVIIRALIGARLLVQ